MGGWDLRRLRLNETIKITIEQKNNISCSCELLTAFFVRRSAELSQDQFDSKKKQLH